MHTIHNGLDGMECLRGLRVHPKNLFVTNKKIGAKRGVFYNCLLVLLSSPLCHTTHAQIFYLISRPKQVFTRL